MSQQIEHWNMWRQLLAVAFAFALWTTAVPCTWASGGHGAAAPLAEEAEIEISEESASGYRAIKLGEFKNRTSNSVLSRKDSVSFIVHATVKKEDFSTFDHFYRHRKIKIRDQIIVATRMVPIEDYDDPELKRFRRRILMRLRRSMPELPIDEIYISDFAISIEAT